MHRSMTASRSLSSKFSIELPRMTTVPTCAQESRRRGRSPRPPRTVPQAAVDGPPSRRGRSRGGRTVSEAAGRSPRRPDVPRGRRTFPEATRRSPRRPDGPRGGRTVPEAAGRSPRPPDVPRGRRTVSEAAATRASVRKGPRRRRADRRSTPPARNARVRTAGEPPARARDVSLLGERDELGRVLDDHVHELVVASQVAHDAPLADQPDEEPLLHIPRRAPAVAPPRLAIHKNSHVAAAAAPRFIFETYPRAAKVPLQVRSLGRHGSPGPAPAARRARPYVDLRARAGRRRATKPWASMIAAAPRRRGRSGDEREPRARAPTPRPPRDAPRSSAAAAAGAPRRPCVAGARVIDGRCEDTVPR